MLTKHVEYLVVDTTAFIQNAPLQDIGKNMITCKDVVDEITSKRQLRRLVVLPYDLVVKDVFPENVQLVTNFTKKTGDYPCLSATDIKVIALTYQLEKEKCGTEHLRNEPLLQRSINVITKRQPLPMNAATAGFHIPAQHKNTVNSQSDIQDENKSENFDSEEQQNKIESDEELNAKLNRRFENLNCENPDELHSQMTEDDVLKPVSEKSDDSIDEEDDTDDESDWITPSNVHKAKLQINSELMEEKPVIVACLTTDFAMQNVLKQMNLNVAALDGRIIKQLRTFILRCYTCFGTTSIMNKAFCPKCGNKTLKRVAVSVDEDGKQQIHINARRPLTSRGKKFSLPTIKGGKHSNNPLLVEDQPMPDQRPTRLARTKNNPLDDDYIAGYSPFVMRDVNSKSAQLKIRPASEVKHWMRKNPNETAKFHKN